MRLIARLADAPCQKIFRTLFARQSHSHLQGLFQFFLSFII